MFKLGITTDWYDFKPQSEDISKFVFKEKAYSSPTDLVNDIRNGYCFSHLFAKDRPKGFSVSNKAKDNFECSYAIFLDIDNDLKKNEQQCSFVTIEDAFEKAERKPQLIYETLSNTPNHPKFRFVYLYDSPMDLTTYKTNFVDVCRGLETFIDRNAVRVSQYFNGSYQGKIITKDNHLLHPMESNIASVYVYDNRYPEKNFGQRTSKLNEASSIESNQNIAIDNEFLKAIGKKEFYECYSHLLVPHSNFVPEPEKLITKLDNTFAEIVRHTTWVGKKPIIQRFVDGTRRKERLQNYAHCLCHIHKDITIEPLIFNILSIRNWYFDNSDKELTVERVIRYCKKAYAERETFVWDQHLIQKRVPKHRVNKAFALKEGYKRPIQAYWKGIRLETNEVIGEQYDISKTMKENQEAIGCSLYAIKQFCKECGIDNKDNRLRIKYTDEELLDASKQVETYIKDNNVKFNQKTFQELMKTLCNVTLSIKQLKRRGMISKNGYNTS